MRSSSILLFSAVWLIGAVALAQEETPPDCENPTTQADMNICAGQAAEAADKALNLQYKKTRAAAVAFDKQMEGAGASAVATLTAAQKAWIPFRDATCAIQTAISGGGSIEPTLVAGCLETETRKRTDELKQLEQDFSR